MSVSQKFYALSPIRGNQWGVFVIGLGAVFGVVELVHMEAMSSSIGVFLEAFLPFVGAGGLVALGYALWAGKYVYDDISAPRVVGWMVAGMGGLGLIFLWVLSHQLIRGGQFHHGGFILVNNLVVGALLGAVIGTYDARGRAFRTEMERQNERTEQFANIVSHDLRNPLNVAAGKLDMARREHDSEYLDDVAEAHSRMREIIEAVLAFARHGQPIDSSEPVRLSSLVEESWRLVDTAGAELVTESDLTFVADTDRVRQLLENLFRNAVEHGGQAVTVTVGGMDDGFFVEDDGPGIPEDEREDAFESGYSTQVGGTGFGLSIVQQIVEAHGWNVRLTEGAAGGARFEITGVSVRK